MEGSSTSNFNGGWSLHNEIVSLILHFSEKALAYQENKSITEIEAAKIVDNIIESIIHHKLIIMDDKKSCLSSEDEDMVITSPLYFAPELFQNDSYRPSQVAVWSLGVVLYTLIAGFLPWETGNLDEQIRNIIQGKFSFPYKISSECKSLLNLMLTVNPSKRATLDQVRNHEWFKLNLPRKGIFNKFLQRSKSREMSIPYEKESPKRVSSTDDDLRVSKSTFKQEVSTWKPTELIQAELERVLNLLSISFQKNESSTKYICRDYIRKVKFAIEICRIDGLEGFKGLKMKRKTGSNYDMRAIEENFLSLLKL